MRMKIFRGGNDLGNAGASELDVRAARPLRLGILAAIFLFCGIFLVAGLAKRQIFESDEYLLEHQRQSRRIVQIPAPRGLIFDRSGAPLVSNRPRYSVTADLSLLRDEIDAEYIRLVRAAQKERNVAKYIRVDRNALLNTARVNILQKHLDRVNVATGRERVLDPAAVIRHIGQRRTLDFPLAENLSERERARFVEQFDVNGPIRLYVDSVRAYPYGELAAHVLGFLKNSEDAATGNIPERHAKIGVSRYRGKVGATGLEKQFDADLCGVPGYRLWMVHPNGYLYNMLEEVKPKQGAHIYSSLDLELQTAVEDAMRAVNRPGAAIALDVKTGEVLAMASAFSYKPEEFSVVVREEYQKELVAKDVNILSNRALQGRYPPGSTFKLLTAIAAMRSGKIAPTQKFDCGSFIVVNKRRWNEHDMASFGETDIARMIRTSSNVFCYNVALEIGWQPIADEAVRFGFDQKIPIGLPEATGRYLVVPTPKYKRDVVAAGGWVAGDTLNMSIGQGFTVISPMHIACMTASIARRETRTRPSILHDPQRETVPVNHGGEPIGLSDEAYAELVRGMEESASVGTGRKAKVEGLRIAGKTGTAQWTNRGKKSNLAWFTGFAPIENPRIALVVVFEADYEDRMAGGATAGPVAGKIFKKWKELYPQFCVPTSQTRATDSDIYPE